MAVRTINILSPKILPSPNKNAKNAFFPGINLPKTRGRRVMNCSNSVNDAELASHLAAQVKKMNVNLGEREEAMKKSREMLFAVMCEYLGVGSEEVKKRWRKMGEEEKRVLVKGFVSEWGANFHPLSAKSVKEMVEEYLLQDDRSPSTLFPGFKTVIMDSIKNIKNNSR